MLLSLILILQMSPSVLAAGYEKHLLASALILVKSTSILLLVPQHFINLSKQLVLLKEVICKLLAEGDADVMRINLSKCALCIKMKFTAEVAEKVAWTADKHMEYHNLPPIVVQHSTHAYELNGYLIDLVRVLSAGYRTAKRLLNLLASEHMHQEMTQKISCQMQVKKPIIKTNTAPKAREVCCNSDAFLCPPPFNYRINSIY